VTSEPYPLASLYGEGMSLKAFGLG